MIQTNIKLREASNYYKTNTPIIYIQTTQKNTPTKHDTTRIYTIKGKQVATLGDNEDFTCNKELEQKILQQLQKLSTKKHYKHHYYQVGWKQKGTHYLTYGFATIVQIKREDKYFELTLATQKLNNDPYMPGCIIDYKVEGYDETNK